MKFTLKHRRPDGTFLVETENGWPYHVVPGDPLFDAVSAAAADAELEPEPPPPTFPPNPRIVTPLVFLNRLKPDERIAIRGAARQSAGLEDWLDMLRAAQEVDLDDPRTISGLNAMVNAGLLTAARRDEILSDSNNPAGQPA